MLHENFSKRIGLGPFFSGIESLVVLSPLSKRLARNVALVNRGWQRQDRGSSAATGGKPELAHVHETRGD